ncbi:hypothetical protein K0M31_007220 [Melipona bicolor]|uniref:ZP domain-containing protein n=1 Tax=Melipona bicolor TaxID=60889 RepID=A0AA40KVG6_9HYME|nr:hypothetical protein K0M31_007220 [Melipona bicolor]
MEFTLRTPEGFIGRIYTYGYYDRCFFRGNGGTVNVLRISGPQGYPECGTQRYGDTMTNIVVVQFSDYVQTGRDKRFNLTCLFRGPGEAVVTSGYIGAGSGSPIPIEYLPAENTLSSRVRLLILYQGRPTTTIAVGDPLTFRLEAQDGYNYVTDIFATNVIARDPYSGRSVQLIDRYGCPVDNYVFPGLDRLRDGDSLEARFNAFKIPESNFLVFEATVRTCRDGCQPAYCSGGTGRSEPSFGRRRRDVLENDTIAEENEISTITENNINDTSLVLNSTVVEESVNAEEEEEEEQVREMIEVLDSRMDIDDETMVEKQTTIMENVCITPNEYYGLVTAVAVLVVLLASVVLLSMLIYRKYAYTIITKNRRVDKVCNRSTHSDDAYSSRANNFSFLRTSLQKPFQSTSISRSMSNVISQRVSSSSTALEGAVGLSSSRRTGFDPSEPIYTNPSLFEVARCSSPKPVHDDNFHFM